MTEEEHRPYRTVSGVTWRRMLALGHMWDINRGGLYDARSGVINLWVSPEDHPASWNDVAITQGALEYPRSYLGEIEGAWQPDGTVVLTLQVTPYERAERQRRGYYPSPEEDEWAWLQAKANALVDTTERLLAPPGADQGVYCRFCDAPIRCQLLNDFLDHLVAVHQVSISAVVLGERLEIHTNAGIILL